MKLEYEAIVFDNGKRVYAFGGILGVDMDNVLTYGHDGRLAAVIYDVPGTRYGDEPLTVEECHEVADFMIARWQQFKASLPATEIAPTESPNALRYQCHCPHYLNGAVDVQPGCPIHGVTETTPTESPDSAPKS